MADEFDTVQAACPVCGGMMQGTVRLFHGWGGDVAKRIPENVRCENGCETQVGDNRSRMLAALK